MEGRTELEKRGSERRGEEKREGNLQQREGRNKITLGMF